MSGDHVKIKLAPKDNHMGNLGIENFRWHMLADNSQTLEVFCSKYNGWIAVLSVEPDGRVVPLGGGFAEPGSVLNPIRDENK